MKRGRSYERTIDQNIWIRCVRVIKTLSVTPDWNIVEIDLSGLDFVSMTAITMKWSISSEALCQQTK